MAGSLKHWNEGHVCHVVIDNAAYKNALSKEILRDLVAVLTANENPDIKILFLRGAGGVFSAGADLNDITGTTKDTEYDELVSAVTGAIAAFPSFVVAVVEGPCFGAAVHLVLSCDMRIAETGATFRIPATSLGLLYNPDAICQLAGSLAPQTLARLFILGEPFSAEQACDCGLVAETYPRGQSENRMSHFAELMGANDRDAVVATKSLLRDLERGASDREGWRETYRTLLGASSRSEALNKAKTRLGLPNT